jgi:hypothetical protein
MSVYGAAPSHSVRARKSDPAAGSRGTSRKKNRQSPDPARQPQSLAPNTEPVVIELVGLRGRDTAPPKATETGTTMESARHGEVDRESYIRDRIFMAGRSSPEGSPTRDEGAIRAAAAATASGW